MERMPNPPPNEAQNPRPDKTREPGQPEKHCVGVALAPPQHGVSTSLETPSASATTNLPAKIAAVDLDERDKHNGATGAVVRAQVIRVGLPGLADEEDLTDTLEHMEPFEVPSVLVNQGLLLLKALHKLKKKIRLWVDSANFRFVYKQVSKNTTHSFYVDDIRSITPRELASHYREELGISKETERRWISLAFYNHRKNKTKLLHLIADTSHDAKRLLYTVGKFKSIKDQIAANFLVSLKDLDEVKRSILSGKAEHADRSTKQVLTFAEVLRYCKRLSINVSEQRLRVLFEQVTRSPKDEIDFEDFKRFVLLLTRRGDIASLYAKLVRGSAAMSFAVFSLFVTETQKESWDLDSLARTFKRFATCHDGLMLEENFAAYLKLKFCATSKEVFLQEDYFGHPLNEYFILSSHNTYLTGRQVAGDSLVEGYVKALQRGCRCLEIDVWNSPVDAAAEPIVNHGRTFTSGILLSNVLATIKKFAFQASRFPLILSLEVHCSIRGQVLMVQILKDVFGGALVLEPLGSRDGLPSPAELKDRVLVKVKKTSSLDESGLAFAQGSATLGLSEQSSSTQTSTQSSSTQASAQSSSTQASQSESAEPAGSQRFKIRRRSASKITTVLSDLGVYCQGLKFRNFSLPELKTYNHCFSLGEKAANNMLRDPEKAAALRKHNRKYFMRVYPSKIRLMSSNFLPQVYWAHGVQMVATNWQTYDVGQQINEAFFDVSQGRGYVLKPPELRRPLMKPTMRSAVKTETQTRFRIEVISAQQLPKPAFTEPVNPYVTLEIVGAIVEWAPDLGGGATPIVAENGFDPTWNLVFCGRLCADSELVFLRLTVRTSAAGHAVDSPKDIGLLVVNLFDLRQGYRHLPLKDMCGELLVYSSLFIRVLYGPA